MDDQMFSYVEEELGDELATGGIVAIASQPWFDRLEVLFPIGLNRISWEKVARRERIAVLSAPREISSEELTVLLRAHVADVARWFSEASVSVDDELIWVGDTADQGLVMRAGRMLVHFPFLMSLPQHSYIFAKGMDWCVNYVMEGELFFGYSDGGAVNG